ncbi:MAG: redoxin domain-containing protein [Chthoniobacterales bacterium]
MKLFLTFLTFIFALATVRGEAVRLAPDFSWESFNGTSKALSGLKNQPVILIIAPSPKSKVFKKQLKKMAPLYRQYAGREALFVAAFTSEPGVVESDIPFLYVRDPQAVAASYGLNGEKFELIVIGPDRNMDLITNQLTSGERVRDVIDNSFPRQAVRRK